jgi:hypothetical protein
VNGQLVGALVVDSLSGAETPPQDRILVLTRWNPSGARDNKGFQLNAFNGRSWPNTERLTYTANDSVRWQVINASNITHEMHLQCDDTSTRSGAIASPVCEFTCARVWRSTRVRVRSSGRRQPSGP